MRFQVETTLGLERNFLTTAQRTYNAIIKRWQHLLFESTEKGCLAFFFKEEGWLAFRNLKLNLRFKVFLVEMCARG